MSGFIFFIVMIVIVSIITNATQKKNRAEQAKKIEEQRRRKEVYNAQMRQAQEVPTIKSSWDSSWEEEEEEPESEGAYFEGSFAEPGQKQPPEQPVLTTWEDVIRRYAADAKPEPKKADVRPNRPFRQEQPQSSWEGGTFGQGQPSEEGIWFGEGEEGTAKKESSSVFSKDTATQKPLAKPQTAPWSSANLLGKDALLYGIILSEILGPPKAKTMARVRNQD